MTVHEQRVEKASKDGSIDMAALRTTIAQMLITQAFALYDDAESILQERGLSIHFHKKLANRLYSDFEKYIEDCKSLMRKEELRDWAKEYDRINKIIEGVVEAEFENGEFHTCGECGERKRNDEFYKYNHFRCKECERKRRRERYKNNQAIEKEMQDHKLVISRKTFQARELHPNALVVPAAKVDQQLRKIIKYYQSLIPTEK